MNDNVAFCILKKMGERENYGFWLDKSKIVNLLDFLSSTEIFIR